MSEGDQYTEVDMSDVVDDSETYFENNQHSDLHDSEPNSIPNSEINNLEDQVSDDKKLPLQKNEVVRSTRLPMSRIKNIMKMDPDVHMVNAEAVFLVTKATEMFLETIVKETHIYTSHHKRKIIAKKDLDVIINKVDCLCFLEGALDF